MKQSIIRLLFVLGVLCFATAAVAFVPSGFRWRLPVPYEVNTGSSQELGRDTTLASIQASYQNWSAPQCSGYRSEFRGETNNSYRVGDGMNTHIWFYNPNQRPRELGGRATIGVTLSLFSGNNASDGDILFNGIDHSWTTNAVRQGQVDAVSIITHEVGHQLGLNHSPFQNATMYAAYLGGNGAATLADDDIEGVCSLYPSGAQADCQNDGDCPGDQRCVGGGCVEREQAGGGAIGDPCGEGIGGCPQGLFCARGADGNAFCTRECGNGCPDGWACQQVQGNNGQIFNICLPDGGGGNQAGRGYGEECQNSSQCSSGFCIGDGVRSFCSQACAGPQDCPPGSECYQVQGGGGACTIKHRRWSRCGSSWLKTSLYLRRPSRYGTSGGDGDAGMAPVLEPSGRRSSLSCGSADGPSGQVTVRAPSIPGLPTAAAVAVLAGALPGPGWSSASPYSLSREPRTSN